jgi:hypothetical protein
VHRRAVTLVLVLLASLVAAPPAHATIGNIFPADKDGPSDVLYTNEALWAIGTSDPTTGVSQVCVWDQYAQTTENEGSGCGGAGSWGQPNTIGVLGTFHQPIVSPYLAPGTYRLYADNGSPQTSTLSAPFTVYPCPVGDCDRSIALEELQEWKDAASLVVGDFAGACYAATAYLIVGELQSGYGIAKSFGNREWFSIIAKGISSKLDFGIPSTGHQRAVELMATVACGAFHMYDDIIADPPDADFEHVLRPAPQTFPTTTIESADAALVELEKMRANGIASRVGVERHQGALAAGDPGWAGWHAGALGQAALEAQRGMRRTVKPLEAFAADLATDPDIQAATTEQVDEVRAIRERVRVSGFLPEELTDLHGLGFDDVAIAEIRQQMGEPLPDGPGGISPAAALQAVADGLGKIDCIDPASSCGFDVLGRDASALGVDMAVPPTIEVADAQITEGDRGVNHKTIDLRLSHPAPANVGVNFTVAPVTTAQDELTLSPGSGAFLEPGDLRFRAEVLLRNDTDDEGDETATINGLSSGAPNPPPITVTVTDDDPHPALTRDRDGVLAMSDGGTVHTALPNGQEIEPAWTSPLNYHVVGFFPDGRHLLIHYDPPTQGSIIDGARYFALPIDADGRASGPLATVTPPGTLGIGGMLSPDGRRFAYGDFDGLGFRLKVLELTAAGAPDGAPHDVSADLPLAGFAEEFTTGWSPDGSHLVFEACKTGYSPCGIYVVPMGPGGATGPAVPVVETEFEGETGTPSWSPDGRFIAYATHRQAGSGPGLERVPVNAAGAPTGPPLVIGEESVSRNPFIASPAWSPDSRSVIFTLDLADRAFPNAVCDCSFRVDLDGAGVPTGPARRISPFGWNTRSVTWGVLADAAPPVTTTAIDPPANANGWHKGDATITLHAMDAHGVASITHDGVTTPGDTATIPVTAEGIRTVTFFATDTRGNAETAHAATVRIDRTAPAVMIAAPSEGAAHLAGAALTADYACADAGSGIDGCSGPVASGAALDTVAPGARELTVSATDRAGNSGTLTRHWTVTAPAAAPRPTATPAPVAIPAAKLPSAKRCVSRRKFRIHLSKPKDDPLVSATVTVNGKRVKVVRGARLTAPIDLRGLPKGRVKVKITATTRSGRILTAARTYHTCVPRKRRP